MSGLRAMRTVMATFDESRLAKVGMRYTDWLPGGSADAPTDVLLCSAGPTLEDCSCTHKFSIVEAVKYTCKPADVEQTEQCCQQFMKPVQEHPCAGYLFNRDPDVNTIGTFVLKRCGLPPVKPFKARCSKHADGETYPTPFTFPVLNSTQCGAISAGIGACVAGIGGNYPQAVDCCVNLEKFSQGGCVCSNCDATCGMMVDQAKSLCGGYQIENKSSCPAPPAPVYTNTTEACAAKYVTFLTQIGKYNAGKELSAGIAMCATAVALDVTDKCHCLGAATGVSVTMIASINGKCAAKGGTTYAGLAECVAPSSLTATCTPLFADYGPKCTAAAAARVTGVDVVSTATACCAAAVPFGSSNCSCASPPLGTMDSFYQVATGCAALGVTVPVPACVTAQIQTCGVNAAEMSTKCTAAVAAPTDLVAGAACCTAAQPVGAANCPCMLPDNVDNTLKLTFGTIATRCNGVGVAALAVNIPSCVATLMPSPVPATPTTPAPTQLYQIPRDSNVAVTEVQALAIIKGWEKAWLDAIPAKAATYTHIDVAYIAGRSLEDTIKEASQGAYALIAVGYVLVVSYIALFFMFSSTNGACGVNGSAPGVASGVAAALVIMLATLSALGISGLLVSAGVLFTALTLQVVPFLALGLGINDYFVMANYVAAAVAAAAEGDTATDVLIRAMKLAGGSITLSSVTNLAAFLLGAITPIPAIRNFSIQVAMTVICNYAVALLVYPSLLYFDIKRHLAGGRDCFVLPIKTQQPAEERSPSSISSAGGLARVVLSSLPLRMLVLAAYAGFFAFCASGISRVKLGLDLQDVVPDDDYLHAYATRTINNYGTYGVYVVTEGVAFESTMEEQRALEHAFASTVPSVDVLEQSVNYARYYTENTEGMYSSGLVCSSELDLYRDKWKEDLDLCGVNLGGVDPNGYRNCAKTCLAHKIQSYAGAANSNSKRCVFAAMKNNSTQYTCKCPYRAIVKPANFTAGFPTFLRSGIRGSVSNALLTLAPGSATTIGSSRSLYYVNDVFDVEAKVAHIKAAREVIAKSALVKDKGANVFAFDYSLYALNEQYVNIEETTMFALGMSLIAAFFCMLVFILHPGTCLIVTALIALVEVELYGLIAWSGLKLNAVVMVNLIMSMGIAVEFLSHIARAFMLARGTRSERAAHAVNTLGLATVNGTLTTFLGILPIAFSYYTYFVNYFFLQYVLILAVCLLQGVVVLPVVLSLVGPDAVDLAGYMEEEEEKRISTGGKSPVAKVVGTAI
mmetsp:Transcript_10021/g.16011  ORF Transcript_10021/g.16011 Transcript_10021/m.16011 type:complete len:1253 (+) Transcript_10021:58-3816(+)